MRCAEDVPSRRRGACVHECHRQLGGGAGEIKAALVRQIVSRVLEDCQRAAAGWGWGILWNAGRGAVLAGFAKRIDKALVIKPACEWADVA